MAEKDGFTIQLPKDLKDVDAWEARAGVQLPPGRYDGVVTRVSQRDAEKGKVLGIVFTVLGGEYEGQESMPDQISLAETALGKFKQFIGACTNGKVDHGQQFRSSSLVGKKLSFEVYNEMYEGTLRNKFRNYMAYDEGNPSPGPKPGAATPASVAAPAPSGDVMDF